MSSFSYAQINLVPNPSFEQYINCPNGVSQLDSVFMWLNPTQASPDYFNSCNINNTVDVPINLAGSENPHTGNAYAGFYAFWLNGTLYSAREYIQASINSTLIIGETYCVEFYLSLADYESNYAVNNIGVYFSTTAVSSTNVNSLPYVPQIENTASNPLTNTNGWTKISGQFIAQGGEHYITIGNFNNDVLSDTILIQNPSFNVKSYYYIDDVSVIHLDADAGKDTAICQGNSILLGRATSPGLTYSWQPAAGLSDTSIAQPIANPTVTTTYYLTATLAGGCSKQDTVTVTVNVVAACAGTDTTLCKGSSATLGTAVLPGITYSWQPATGLNNSAIAQPIATPNLTTTYYLTAIIAGGCSKQDTVTVTVNVVAANAGTDTTLCKGSSATIGTAILPDITYSWQPATGLNNAVMAQPIASPTVSTTYYLTATLAGGCSKQDTVRLTVNDVSINAGNDNSLCEGSSVTLGTAILPGITYNWQPTTGLNNPAIAQPIATPITTTSYTLTAEANGCIATDTINLTVIPDLAVNAGVDFTIISGTSTLLTGSALAGSTFNWSPSSYLSCDTCASTIALPASTTIYILTASKNSCSSSDTVTVYVDTDCGELFVPNVFSPNGDNQNDVLKVYGNCISSIDFLIFNRWGEKVFESTELNTSWDGTYKGAKLDEAVFVYYLTATVNGVKVVKKGNVSIVR